MNEISPTYYAAGRFQLDFMIYGENLELIPDDALACGSYQNNRPLEHIHDNIHSYDVMSIVERGDGFIRFTGDESVTRSPEYLGVIRSADESLIYWINTTRPLP